MTKMICGQCQSTEFVNVVSVDLDSNGKVLQLADEGIIKCSNCSTRFQIADDATVVPLETAPQSRNVTPRVRSSVSAAERGKGGSGPSQF